jgi:hypothetical protein
MFCPHCGMSQSEELKFCKSCGANLYAIRQVVMPHETEEKPVRRNKWGSVSYEEWKEWEREEKLREYELERQLGITPEVKRYSEIKAGVITSCVGVGLMIFLFVFMQGLILGGNIPPHAVEIVGRIWIAGVLPLFVGLGLLINGVLVSKRLVEISKRELQSKEMPPALWYESDSPKPSVTENTTRQLKDS